MTNPTDIPGVAAPGSIGAEARAVVILADYANTDAGNKLNIIGGGWQGTRRVPVQPGALGLPSQAVVVVVDVPPHHANEPFPLSLALHNSRDEIVSLPGPAGPQQMRVAQNVTAAMNVPNIPQGRVPARVQFILNLDVGMPLEPDDLYTWRLELAGHRNPQWQASFFVAAEPAPPVVG